MLRWCEKYRSGDKNFSSAIQSSISTQQHRFEYFYGLTRAHLGFLIQLRMNTRPGHHVEVWARRPRPSSITSVTNLLAWGWGIYPSPQRAEAGNFTIFYTRHFTFHKCCSSFSIVAVWGWDITDDLRKCTSLSVDLILSWCGKSSFYIEICMEMETNFGSSQY